jgi:hypothetical protein
LPFEIAFDIAVPMCPLAPIIVMVCFVCIIFNLITQSYHHNMRCPLRLGKK